MPLGLEQLIGCQQDEERKAATPIATTPSPALPHAFFWRPAEVVAPDLVGCRLVKRQTDGSLLWGVIVETEAYSQDDPACHGYRRRSPQNETLFGEPGRFYVYVSYGIHHCVKQAGVSKTAIWALSLRGRSCNFSQYASLLVRRLTLFLVFYESWLNLSCMSRC